MVLSRLTLIYPGIIVFLYLLSSFLIGLYGPIKYVQFNKSVLLLYLLVFFFGFVLIIAINNMTRVGKRNFTPQVDSSRYAETWYSIFLKVIFIIKIGLLVESYFKFGIDMNDSFYQIYANTYLQKSAGEFSEDIFFRKLDTLLTPLYYFALFFVFTHFRTCRLVDKILSIAVAVQVVFYTVFFLGDQKPILDLFVLVFISRVFSIIRFEQKNLRISALFKVMIFILVMGLIFGSVIAARSQLFGKDESYVINSFMEIDKDHFLIFWMPKNIAIAVSSFLMYPTMGWYGLSLSFQTDFTWSYGLGAFRGVNSYLTQLFGIEDHFHYTYLAAIENDFGYDGLSNWNTIFPWLASDFTFVGAIIIVWVCVYLLLSTWRRALIENSYIELVCFYNLCLLFIYSPANNQVFHQRSSALASIVIFILFLFKRAHNAKFKT